MAKGGAIAFALSNSRSLGSGHGQLEQDRPREDTV